MTDKTKKIIKWIGLGVIALGSVGMFIGGGSETEATAVIGGVFVIIGIISTFLKVE